MTSSNDIPDPSGKATEDPAENKLLDKLRDAMPSSGGSMPPKPAAPVKDQAPAEEGSKP